MTVPSSATDQSPDLEPLIASWTSLPSRGPAARALTVSFCETPYDAASGASDVEQPDRLDVELVGDDAVEAGERRGVVDDHGERGQRQPVAQAGRLAQRRGRRADVTDRVHRGDQRVVRGQLVGRRPVGQVHRAATGQPAPDLLGGQRQQRRGDPADHVEHGVEGVEAPRRCRPRTGRASGGCTSWSARRGTTRVESQAAGDLVVVELVRHRLDVLAALGQQVAVQRVGRRRSTTARRTRCRSRRRWRRGRRSTSCSTAGSSPGAPSRGCPAR